MAIGRVAGHPDYTFDGLNKNIPILFSGKTLEKFYAAVMMSEITNTDYVGEVSQKGDKVIIRTEPDVTIKDYNKGQRLEIEHPESPSIEFTVDHAKYFNFAIDDIDTKQFDIKMVDKWAANAAIKMKIAIETEFFASIYASADAANIGLTAGKISGDLNFGAAGTPLALTKTNILEKLIDINLCLDEQNIPPDGRFVVLPSWAMAMLKKSDIKDASLTGDASSPLRTGRVGSIDNLNLYSSNLLATTTDTVKVWYAIYGQKMGMQFVSQLTKVESYRPQDSFSDAMKGLNVYGYGCLQPTALGYLYIKK